MDKVISFLMDILSTIIAITAITAFLAIPFMLLYNYVVPTQFGLKEIDFLHSWAFLALSSLIFKSPALQDEKD